ncbi:hypothetical protein DUI87_10124 [Hirundo rustica rustica]|uniref:Sulfotransferase n=1 Tax=Hirundo rustica rustica TaxID=333673 RepID=A0A3M0KHC2_HIRRU|nr:hypothetical protein DUI87_10124 [Hirundo rustica rustica]
MSFSNRRPRERLIIPGEKDGLLIVGTKSAAFMAQKDTQQNPQDKEEPDKANSAPTGCKNVAASVKQIAAFFGFSPTAARIQAIAGGHTFQAMSVKAQETHGAVGLVLFQKGDFGDWKDVFAEAQNQKLATKFTVCLEVA